MSGQRDSLVFEPRGLKGPNATPGNSSHQSPLECEAWHLTLPRLKISGFPHPCRACVHQCLHKETEHNHLSPMADARLRFLNASARYYAITAPSTAAHLMLQHAQVAEESGLPYGNEYPPDTCGACGTIAVADIFGDRLPGESEIDEQRLNAPVTLPSPMLMTSRSGKDMPETKCATCHRTTKKPAARLGAAGREGPRQKQATTSAAHQSDALAPEHSPNNGSRQRPKVRKRGGLQAMVERSRVSRATSLTSGLGLMDLMKAG